MRKRSKPKQQQEPKEIQEQLHPFPVRKRAANKVLGQIILDIRYHYLFFNTGYKKNMCDIYYMYLIYITFLLNVV